ncbi:MAG: DUF429 domain-containing protein [Lachnospiraceae bacterium]
MGAEEDGLPSNRLQYEQRPDTEARRLIVPRTSTIFAVPSRQAVYEESQEAQIKANMAALGKSLAKQTMAIIPKMRELDLFLSTHEQYKNLLKESHPEVCFSRLNGAVVREKKSDPDGCKKRVRILSAYLPNLSEEFVTEKAKERKCNADDILDAICLAVTANLDLQSETEVLPKQVMTDDHGLRMQMIIPKRKVYTTIL